MNKTYKITLKLWFEKKTNIEYDDDMSLQDWFNKTKKDKSAEDKVKVLERDGFNPEAYLKKYDINEFIEGIYYDHGKIISAKWLDDLEIEFIYEFYEPITIEQIREDLLTNSLEDGAYEGNYGWVAFKENEDEYGLFDYRCEECITIEAL